MNRYDLYKHRCKKFLRIGDCVTIHPCMWDNMEILDQGKWHHKRGTVISHEIDKEKVVQVKVYWHDFQKFQTFRESMLSRYE